MVKFKNNQHKMFSDTLNSMRKLINNHKNKYNNNIMGTGQKIKLPYTHLIGRRKKLKMQYKQEKNDARQQNIQYDSSKKMLNEGLKQKHQKDNFTKNKYKFKGLKCQKIGNQRNGFLQFTKQDVKKIQQSNKKRFKFQNEKKYHKKNKKNFQHHKKNN